MTILDVLVEPWTLEFMRDALLASVVAAVVCAVISCWIVLIGWSLMGDAVSHAVLPGVVLSYLLGLPFAVGAVVFGFGAVGLIGVVRTNRRIKADAAIGIVFTTLFALGLVLVSSIPSQTDLGHILFGNVLGVAGTDLVQLCVLAAVVIVVLLLRRRDLTLVTFDPTHAHTIGLRPQLTRGMLLALLALTCVIALQIVGVILVVAMLIIPGSTARLLTDRLSTMLLVAPVVAALTTITGLYFSYWFDVAPGGMIVLAQGVVFALAWLAAPRHGLLATLRH